MPAITSQFLPANTLEWIAMPVGIFVGMIFALDWKIPKNLASAVADPRLKSLKYFLGGFILTLIADWQKIVGADFQVSKLRVTGFYAIPFLLSTATTLLIVSFLIAIQSRAARRQKPGIYPGPPFNPVLEYLHYGYAHYKDEYGEQVAKRESAEEKKVQEARAVAVDALTLCIAAFEKCTDAQSAGFVVQQILTYVCRTAESYLGTGPVNSNYMLAVRYATASREQLDLVRYAFGETEHYEFLLLLQSYAKPEGNETFALAIGHQRQGWEDSALPGAPTAFLGPLSDRRQY